MALIYIEETGEFVEKQIEKKPYIGPVYDLLYAFTKYDAVILGKTEITSLYGYHLEREAFGTRLKLGNITFWSMNNGGIIDLAYWDDSREVPSSWNMYDFRKIRTKEEWISEFTDKGFYVKFEEESKQPIGFKTGSDVERMIIVMGNFNMTLSVILKELSGNINSKRFSCISVTVKTDIKKPMKYVDCFEQPASKYLVFDEEGEQVLFCKKDAEGTICVPQGIKVIKKEAFQNCVGITNIKFPDTIEVIEESAFRYCNRLLKVILPKSLLKIDKWTFNGCKNLSDIQLNEELETIACGVWEQCDNIKNMHIGSKVNSLRWGLPQKVTVDSKNPYYRIDDETFLYDKRNFNLVFIMPTLDCKELIIPAKYKSIEAYVFSFHENNIETIIVNQEVIGGHAFGFAKNTKALIINSQIKRIESNFICSTKIESIIFNTSNLDNLEFNVSAFDGFMMGNCTLYVPCSALTKYKSHPMLKGFKDIKSIDESEVFKKTKKTIENKTRLIIKPISEEFVPIFNTDSPTSFVNTFLKIDRFQLGITKINKLNSLGYIIEGMIGSNWKTHIKGAVIYSNNQDCCNILKCYNRGDAHGIYEKLGIAEKRITFEQWIRFFESKSMTIVRKKLPAIRRRTYSNSSWGYMASFDAKVKDREILFSVSFEDNVPENSLQQHPVKIYCITVEVK